MSVQDAWWWPRDRWWPIDLIGCQMLGKSFVGGWSVEEVLRTGAELKQKGYGITYNLLTEDLRDEKKVNQSIGAIYRLLSLMTKENSGNIAIKPTQCGLMISYDIFLKRVESIVEYARMQGVETEFDAERWEFIPDTFRAFQYFASKLHYRSFVRLAVQEHLVDIFDLMDEYELWDKKLRLVKGSGVYREKKKIIWRDRARIVRQHETILRRNHMAGQVPYVATIRDIDRIARARKILPSPFMVEFQTLYGPFVDKVFGKLLAGEDLWSEEGGLHGGWPVRVYIPFVVSWCKDEWLPYGLRRAATIRHLFFADKQVRQAIFQEFKNKLKKERPS